MYISTEMLPTTTTYAAHYTNYLRAVYTLSPVTRSDKWPPTTSKSYIKLALVKKDTVNRGEADHFTCLTLQGQIDHIQAKQPIALDDVLKVEDKARLVLVEGAPGIGKSTFAWELCQQWAMQKSLKQFSLVVLLKLREETVQRAKVISDLLYHRNTELRRFVGEEVEKSEGDGVLFVFDGFDEFPADVHKESLVMEVISGTYLPKATVLVTSRPSATAKLQAVSQADIGKHIEVVGFSEKEIRLFAESIFGSGSDLLFNFLTYVSVNPVVRGMMYNPLNCGIVLEVYRQHFKGGKPIPHTYTQLYTELTLFLLSRHLSSLGDPLARTLPDRLEYIPHQSTLYKQIMKLGRLAFEGRVKEEVIFKQLPEGCTDLGLLNTCSELYGRKENVTYNFLHLTLQEFLGGFYVSQLPANEQRILFVEHHKLDHLNVVWRFVAGLTRMQSIGWEGLKWNAEVGDREDKGYEEEHGVVKVWPSVVQSLYEAQDARSCQKVFKQSKVECYGWKHTTPFDAYALGYSVSLCGNVWDVDLGWSGLGPELMEMLMYGMKSVEHGGGSIEKLTLQGNSISDKGIQYFYEWPHQILQQIKTLRLSHCNLTPRGFDALADVVPLLPNLVLLDVSMNAGGSAGTAKRLQALNKHNKLQRLELSHTGLGNESIYLLSKMIHPSKPLTVLSVGDYSMFSGCLQQLVRTLLSPSSLSSLAIFVPFSESPLHYIETISEHLTSLTFVAGPANYTIPPPNLWPVISPCGFLWLQHLRANMTVFLRILKETSTSLTLLIPLNYADIQAILKAIKNNLTLTTLALSKPNYFILSQK